MGEGAKGDDRILPATRWTFLLFALILIAAVLVIWGTPDRTADRWAWTIQPDMTPIFMGSVYAAGAVVFIRLFLAEEWHPYGVVLIGAIVLTTLLLAATLIHFDRFNHGDGPLPADIAFYGWVGIYALAPAWTAFLWLRNRGADPGTRAGDPLVPRAAKGGATALGVVAVALAALLWLWPEGAAADAWPWPLSPLTARVIGAYLATIGALGIVLGRDPRASSWRVIVQTLLVFCAFLLVGSMRETAAFDDGVAAPAFIALVAAGAVALLVLLRVVDSSRTRG